MSLGKSIFGVPIGRPTFESIAAPIAAKAMEAEYTKSNELAAKLEGVL